MKLRIVIGIAMLPNICCAGQQALQDRMLLPVTIIINNTSDPRITATTTQTTQRETIIAQPTTVVAQLPVVAPPSQQLSTSFLSGWFLLKIAAIGTAVGAAWYYLKQPSYDRAWSSWRADVPLTDLAEQKRSLLVATLFDEITTYYTQHSVVTTGVDPLFYFVRDIDAEYAYLIWCRRARSCWQLLPSYFCSGNAQALLEINEKIKKITWMKKIVGSWMAQVLLHKD